MPKNENTPAGQPDGLSCFDIIVIGSGPAGCAAAINATNLGLSVLLLTKDRHSKPQSRSVSEHLHSGSRSVFEHLDAQSVIEYAQTGVFHTLQTSIGTDGKKSFFMLREDEAEDSCVHQAGIPFVDKTDTGIHINRDKFDYAFVELARNKVTQFIAATTVVDLLQLAGTFTGVKTRGGIIYSARFVIDASGNKRFAGSLLKLKVQYYSPPLWCLAGKIISSVHSSPLVLPQVVQLHANEHGWTWLAVDEAGQYSYIISCIKKHDDIAWPAQIKGDAEVLRLRKHSLRWQSYRTTAMPGLILCGDAGFIMDPATGEGMLNAMYSGIEASETIFRCILEPDDALAQLQSYDQRFNELVSKKVRQVTSFYNAHGIEF